MIAYTPKKRLEAFRNSVSKRGENDCWPYLGYLDRGYGVARDLDGKQIRAHRLAFKLANPEDDIKGFSIRHTCDNPCCCNPKHLLKGSHADNMRDKKERNRCYRPTGNKHHQRKMDAALVEKLRKEYKPKIITARMLAEKYGISKYMVWNAVLNRTWVL